VSRGFQALFVACILVASTAMFALAESRKLDKAPIKALVLSAGPATPGVQRPAIFSPSCACPTRFARISFKLGKPGSLQAWIVSPSGTVIRQLIDRPHVRNVTLRWNGDTTGGQQAADGSYRLRIRTAGTTRTLPVFVVVKTSLPDFQVHVAPRSLTLNGDGVDDRAVITWSSSLQLFDIHVIAQKGSDTQTIPVFRHSRAGAVPWPRVTCANGRCRVKERPPPGRWTLKVVAEDQAGNRATVSAGAVQVANR
jgi:hypothetical protein